MRARLSVVFILAVLFAVLPATAAMAQPDNDDFGSATSVNDLPFEDTVDVSEATVEPDEPTEVCVPMTSTVWYGVTLQTATDVTVDTAGSDYDTVLAVWTGSEFADFDLVDCVDDTFTGSLQAAVTFSADAGVTYWVQVAAFADTEPGTLQISIAEAGRLNGKPAILKANFRGLSALAFSESFDENGGTFASINLQEAREKLSQERPIKSAFVFVSLFEESFDEVEGTVTFTDWFGVEELEPSEYSLDRRLRSAHVATSIMLFCQECTEGPFEDTDDGFEFDTECVELEPVEVELDVSWDGTGGVFQNRFMERSSGDGFRSSFLGRSTSREADVEGGFSDTDLEFDFTGADGFLSRDSSADMLIIRGPGFGIF